MKWVSWVQRTYDARPLTYPPNDGVIGWWCSGYDTKSWPILCALLNTDNEKDAKKIIKKDWPEWTKWRFIEDCENWEKSSRFPMSKWMKDRLTQRSRRGEK